MKRDAATPLVAVRRKQKGFRGQQVGTIATSPKKVDSIIRNEYGAIYKGNGKKGEDPEVFADGYLKEYEDFIFKQPEMEIEDITGEDVEATVQNLKETGGGS